MKFLSVVVFLCACSSDGAPTLDSSFGAKGTAATPTLSLPSDSSEYVQVDAQNRIYVNDQTVSGGGNQTTIVRFTAAGAVDTTFATSGVLSLSSGIDTMVVAHDGSLFVFNSENAVKYTADGVVDSSFQSSQGATAGAIASDGSVYVAFADASGFSLQHLDATGAPIGSAVAYNVAASPTQVLIYNGDTFALAIELSGGVDTAYVASFSNANFGSNGLVTLPSTFSALGSSLIVVQDLVVSSPGSTSIQISPATGQTGTFNWQGTMCGTEKFGYPIGSQPQGNPTGTVFQVEGANAKITKTLVTGQAWNACAMNGNDQIVTAGVTNGNVIVGEWNLPSGD